MDFFVIKKLVGTLVAPMPIGMLLFTCALVAAWFSDTSRWVRWPLTIGWLLTGTLSLYPVASSWLLRYEGLYPAYTQQQEWPVEQIIVLGCFGIEDPQLPVSSQLHPCSSIRLIEAMRIWRQHPDSKLILSGGKTRFGQLSNAEMGANLLMALGVPETAIVLSPVARDTDTEAIAVKKLLGPNPPVLVTSASHMKRAVRVFARHGISVIAAPSEHLIRAPSGQQSSWREWIPKASNLYNSERAWYATMGNALVTLQGIFGADDEKPTPPPPLDLMPSPVADPKGDDANTPATEPVHDTLEPSDESATNVNSDG
ncbi:YdcF family protein [Neiella marina]|uniref:YdcF family protein n=1 Tax=Neiella holothuriorum TaxID=2870530 RepID=A0ABS7EKH0_9GAMM|nr:ElyC/SanA/YdcF family protein [Neiella holothuriorum]MBW8192853.1 YdcF family protein [Neiella holothuriorum]